MIKIGGVNVAPLEVEQVLPQHPDIVQAYVAGLPDRSKAKSPPRQSSCGPGRQRIPRQSSPSAVSGWQATRHWRGSLFARGTAPAHADGQDP
jgi:acyl-CoA synthetase (AMP-forming)/AMP-acid ligase II